MDVQTRILMTLLPGPLPQSTIQHRSARKESTRTSPRIMETALDILQQEKCITFENKKTWRRGQKKIYKLTEKGRHRLLEGFLKQVLLVSDMFENSLKLVSYSQSFRQRWQEELHHGEGWVAFERVLKSLNECLRKMHESYLDLGIVSIFEPLRKQKGLPVLDAKTILENSVLCFDHSAKGQAEDDLPFRYFPREGFKAMWNRASPEEKGEAPPKKQVGCEKKE